MLNVYPHADQTVFAVLSIGLLGIGEVWQLPKHQFLCFTHSCSLDVI